MIWLKNLHIELKQGFIIAMLIVANAILCFSLYKYYYSDTQRTHTVYGLEKQSALLELLLNYTSEDTSRTQELYNNIALSQTFLSALNNGGTISGLGEKIIIPATKNTTTRQLIRETEHLWNEYEEMAIRKEKIQGIVAETEIISLLSKLENNTNSLIEQYSQHYRKEQVLYIYFICGSLILVFLILYIAVRIFRTYIKNPIHIILNTLQQAATGNLSRHTNYSANDEVGKIAHAIDALIENQLKLSEFAEKIGEGNFEMDHELLKEGDKLGTSLANMREKLQKVSVDDKKRIWATEGMAKFGDILRSSSDDIQSLSEKIITNLVKYLNANQGAIFILYEENERELYLELTATYAWNRKKGIKKRIEVGEGLAGQVIRDKDTIYITDVPDSYVNISSGLGKANPNCILVIPLKINEEIHGVIELASFHKYATFEIDFIEKLSESIAATLSSVKTNEKTRKLLDEARIMNEQMRSQEEEMRQNLEELSSTQEEMQRKEAELTGLFTCIDSILATIEFDLDGYIITANTTFCKLMKYSLEEIKGQHHSMFVEKVYARSDEYREFWNDLKNGITKIVDVKRITKTGEQKWLSGSYTPVFDKNGNPYKVIKLAQDITEKKIDELNAKTLSLVADNTENSVIITDKNGLIEYANQGFTRMTGYTFAEVANKKPGSFLQGSETSQVTVQRIRETIRERKPFYDEILNYHKEGKAYWVSLAINPVFNEQGELDKYISVQANITDTKIKNLDYNSKLEAISKSNCIIEFTIEGNIITANENFLNLMEYELNEIEKKHYSIFVGKTQKQSQEYKQLWDKLHKGEFVAGDFLQVSKSGKEVWIRGVFNVILDINGKPYKIIKFVQDVTAEKQLAIEAKNQAEELSQQGERLRKYTSELEDLQRTLSKKLEEAKGEMKVQIKELEFEKAKNIAILEGCVDGVVAFNHRGTVEFFNKAAEEIWRIPRSEILRRSITLLMPIAFSEEGFNKVVFAEGELKKELAIRTEVSLVDKSGEDISVLVTLTQVKLGEEYTYTLFVQKISVELF